MSPFQFLHRAVKAALLLVLACAFALLWRNRDLGLPVLDLYLAWDASGYHSPDPLHRTSGTVSRVLAENVVEFHDQEGRRWNVGLSGLLGVVGDGKDPARLAFAYSTRTNLAEAVVGRTAEIAWVSSNPNQTGLGFLYLGSHPYGVAVDLVSEGRLRLRLDDVRHLPLLEQMKLRTAERRARSEQRGLWDPKLHLRLSS